MPTSVYIESPESVLHRLKPKLDGSVDVNVTNANLNTTIQEPLDVIVTNPPADQVVHESPPALSDILRASRTTTGTLITVPSGRVFRGSAEVSCSIAVAGNSQPFITDGVNEIIRCEAVGLALTTVTNSASISDVYIAGPATVTFTAGAGSSSGSIAGRLL